MYTKQELPVVLPLVLNEPVQTSYIAHGHTYIKWSLPTDTVYQLGCEGETMEP